MWEAGGDYQDALLDSICKCPVPGLAQYQYNLIIHTRFSERN